MSELSADTALIGPWVFAQINKPWHPVGKEALGLVRDGEVLAGVVFEDYTGVAVSVHIAIGDKHAPVRQLFIAACEYAYNQLGVNKVVGLVSTANLAALSLDLRIGFTPEAIIKGIYPDGDLVILSMSKEDCRWLRRPKEVKNGQQSEDSEAA